MTDRVELLESALDSLPQGMALCDCEGRVVLWNHAAESITGFGAADLIAHAIPEPLEALVETGPPCEDRGAVKTGDGHELLVHARHALGHDMVLIGRISTLRNALGEPIGSVAFFHPAERLDALAEGGSDSIHRAIELNEAEFEERLLREFSDFEHGGQTLGVLWIAVDQGPNLRKTHGGAACQAMMEKMRRTISSGLRPAEEIGRWGEDEFLILAHERTAEMLAAHAQTLAGLARTADLRWWGDRISLTVSIGAAQAGPGESLPHLLKRAHQAMETSVRQSGNCVTFSKLHNPDQAASSSERLA